MITETHQCPLCGHILTQQEIDMQQCDACCRTFLPKQINTMPAAKDWDEAFDDDLYD